MANSSRLRSSAAILLAAIISPEVAAQSDRGSEPYREYTPRFGVYDPHGSTIETTASISGIRDYFEHDIPRVFQSARIGMDAYRFRIPNGSYRVFLNFAEIEKNSIGERVFGVTLQGQPVVGRLDIFKEVGADRAYQIVSEYVEVSDGTLSLEFQSIVGEPLLSGISIGGEMDGVPLGALFQHVNCGGSGHWYPDFGIDDPRYR